MTTDERRIVLVGKIRAGKSATGNTILMRNWFPVGSATKEFSLRETFNKVTQKTYKVLDTPGIGVENEDKLERGYALQRAILHNVPNPHALLLVFDPCDCKYVMELVNQLKRWFGASVTDHLILVFTRRKLFETDIEFAEFLGYDERFDFVELFGKRIIGIENYGEGRFNCQKELLNMIETTALNGKSAFRLILKPYYHFKQCLFGDENDNSFNCHKTCGSRIIHWKKALHEMPMDHEKERGKQTPLFDEMKDCIENGDETIPHQYQEVIPKVKSFINMSPTDVAICRNTSPVRDCIRKPLTLQDVFRTIKCAKTALSCLSNMKDDPIESLISLALIASNEDNVEAIKNVVNSEEVQFLLEKTAPFVEKVATAIGKFLQEIVNDCDKKERTGIGYGFKT